MDMSQAPSLILSREWTDQLKEDTGNAINLLMMQGKLHPETNYQFKTDNRGRPRVWVWLDFGAGPIQASCVEVDPLDLITGAGRLELVRGKSDSL